VVAGLIQFFGSVDAEYLLATGGAGAAAYRPPALVVAREARADLSASQSQAGQRIARALRVGSDGPQQDAENDD
jgi:hypothetical protein